MKKLKIFISVALVGILVVVSGLIWAGVSAVGYVYDQVARSNIEARLSEISGNVTLTQPVKSEECLKQAQSMLNVDVWLTQPMDRNFALLKKSCFHEDPENEVREDVI